MSEEEDDDLVVPRPDAPIVEEPYPYWLLNPRTGAALDIHHFVYGDFFWNIDRVYGKKPVYKADEGIYTFIFTVVWRETWHSRAMIRQLGQLRPRLRFRVRERVHRNVNGFQEFLVKWSPTKEFFVNFSEIANCNCAAYCRHSMLSFIISHKGNAESTIHSTEHERSDTSSTPKGYPFPCQGSRCAVPCS